MLIPFFLPKAGFLSNRFYYCCSQPKKGDYRRRSRGTGPTVTPTRTITPTATATHTPPTPVTNPPGVCFFWCRRGGWSMEYAVFGMKKILLFDFIKKNIIFSNYLQYVFDIRDFTICREKPTEDVIDRKWHVYTLLLIFTHFLRLFIVFAMIPAIDFSTVSSSAMY